MDKFGIIGWPVAHSKSPKLFTAAYHGEFQYDLIGSESFEDCWNTFTSGEYRAINVTAPYKEAAFRRAEVVSDEVRAIGAANIIVKAPDGLTAYNSDYLGVRKILAGLDGVRTACVVGFGGAGKAAAAASEAVGFDTKILRHNELTDGVQSDVVIYTLPKYAPGAEKIRCRFLIEANYKDPCLQNFEGICGEYIPGTKWLLEQAIEGYGLMAGKNPDKIAILAVLDI